MSALSLIFISLFTVWFDAVLTAWLPLYCIPLFVWLGVHISVLYFNNAWRRLWIFSLSIWSLYWITIKEALIFAFVWLSLGELFAYINRRYLQLGSSFLGLVPSFLSMVVAYSLVLFLSGQDFVLAAAGRLAVTLLIIAVIVYFYDPKKAKK